MVILAEVSSIFDDYHLDDLYRVCRFCYNRIASKVLPKDSLLQPPSQFVSNRAHNYYQVDSASEVVNLLKPKDICSICQARLSNLEIGKLTITKWELDRSEVEFSRIIEESLCITRSTVGCNS